MNNFSNCDRKNKLSYIHIRYIKKTFAIFLQLKYFLILLLKNIHRLTKALCSWSFFEFLLSHYLLSLLCFWVSFDLIIQKTSTYLYIIRYITLTYWEEIIKCNLGLNFCFLADISYSMGAGKWCNTKFNISQTINLIQ